MPAKSVTFFQTTLTTKGQILIPRQIRRLLGLQPRQQLFVHTDGSRIIVTGEDPHTAAPATQGRPTTEEVGRTAGARSAITRFKHNA